MWSLQPLKHGTAEYRISERELSGLFLTTKRWSIYVHPCNAVPLFEVWGSPKMGKRPPGTPLLSESVPVSIVIMVSHHYNNARGGSRGGLGVRTPPPPFLGGPHNVIKRGKNVMRVHAKTPCFSTLQLPGPPLSEILYQPLNANLTCMI